MQSDHEAGVYGAHAKHRPYQADDESIIVLLAEALDQLPDGVHKLQHAVSHRLVDRRMNVCVYMYVDMHVYVHRCHEELYVRNGTQWQATQYILTHLNSYTYLWVRHVGLNDKDQGRDVLGHSHACRRVWTCACTCRYMHAYMAKKGSCPVPEKTR